MADQRTRYPLDHLKLPSRAFASADVTVMHRRGLAFCQVLARKDHGNAVAKALGISTTPGTASQQSEFTALPLAPRQWLLMATVGRDGAFTRGIAERIAGLGYASEQSHGRAAIRVYGPQAATVLAKECRLDLDTQAVPVGFVAQTVIGDVGVLLHRVDNEPTYDLILYPGFTEHFWNWLNSAAAEFSACFVEEIVA